MPGGPLQPDRAPDVRVILSTALGPFCTIAAVRDARRTVVVIRPDATIGEVTDEIGEVLTTVEHDVIRAAYGWPALPTPLPPRLLGWPIPLPPPPIRARGLYQ